MFIRSRTRTVPEWLPLLGGRRVRWWLVIAPLLMPIALLAQFNLATVPYMLDGFSMPGEVAETLPPCAFWGQVAIFWVWGVALAITRSPIGSRPAIWRGA